MFSRLNKSQDKNRNLPLRAKFGRMDIVGTTLFLGAICCLIFALQQGGQTVPWNSSTIVGSFVGFGILFLAFSFVQWTRGETALIPLRVLRQRSILMGNFYLFFIGILTGVVRHTDLTVLWRLLMLIKYGFYLPFYFQVVQGVSATTSGVRMIPRILPQIFALIIASAIVTRWGYYVSVFSVDLINPLQLNLCLAGSVYDSWINYLHHW